MYLITSGSNVVWEGIRMQACMDLDPLFESLAALVLYMALTPFLFASSIVQQLSIWLVNFCRIKKHSHIFSILRLNEIVT